jgi:hypothetical protein
MTIVLHGYYSENATAVLRPYLEQAGLAAIDLNELSDRNQIDTALGHISAGCTVITSCHFFCTGKAFQRIYPKLRDPLTPLDFLQIKHAHTKFVFLAHDLAEPIKDSEWPLIDIFDKIFLPRPVCLPRYIPQISPLLAWYKDLVPSAPLQPVDHAFLPTNVWHELGVLGIHGYLDRYKDILAAGLPWKLAAWSGFEPLITALQNHGVDLLPSETNSRDIIAAANAIVTNHVGSVAWETIRHSKPCFLFKRDFLDMLQVSRLVAGVSGVCVLRELADLGNADRNSNCYQGCTGDIERSPESLFAALLTEILGDSSG